MKRRARLTMGLHGYRNIPSNEPVYLPYKGTAKGVPTIALTLQGFQVDNQFVIELIPDDIVLQVI